MSSQAAAEHPVPHRVRARWATWTLILGACTNVAFLLEGYVGAELDPTRSFVSELGGLGQPAAMYFRASDFVTGVLLLVGAIALWTLLPTNPALRLGVAASMVFAVLTAADAFLPLDCAPTVDAACRAAEDAGNVSWQHAAHNVTGVVESVAASLAMILIAWGVWLLQRRRALSGSWESVWQQLVVFGVVYALLSVAVGVMYLVEMGPIGTLQRVQIVIYAAGMFTLGLAARIKRIPHPDPPATAPSGPAAGKL